jgi:hypothetical protein
MNKTDPHDIERRQFAAQWYAGLSEMEKREADRFIASLQGAIVARPLALECLFALKLWVENDTRCQRC